MNDEKPNHTWVVLENKNLQFNQELEFFPPGPPQTYPCPPDEVRHYTIGGIWSAGIEVILKGAPPCLFCQRPVLSPSCDGPLVCSSCDCGRNSETGERWTEEEGKQLWDNRNTTILEYKRLDDERKANARTNQVSK